MPALKVAPKRLPQNGREDKIVGFEFDRRTDPTTSELGADRPTSAPTGKEHPTAERMPALTSVPLLRKEVIQPHLPVRLPCYDFTPITDPTFDGSLPCGLGHRLRVLPTFVV